MWLILLVFCMMTVFSWLTLCTLAKDHKLIVFTKVESPYLYISDFTSYYAMAKLASSPKRTLLYDPKVQDEFVNQVISPFHTHKVFYGQYLPWFYSLIVPFTWLHHIEAFVLFNILTVIFASASIALLGNSELKENNFKNIFLITAIVIAGINASLPFWQALFRGNSILFAVGLFSLYCFGLNKHKDILSGFALALLCYKPQFAVMASIPAFRYRRWKLLITAFIVEFLLFLFAAIQVGFNNVINFPTILFTVEKNCDFDGIYVLQHVNLRAFYAAYISQNHSMIVSIITYLAVLILLFWLWSTIQPSNLKLKRWALAITTMSALVMSPHTLLYDLSLLSIAIVLTLPDWQISRKNIVLSIWFVLMTIYPFVSWYLHIIEPLHTHDSFQHQYSALFNLVLLVSLCLGYFSIKQKAKTENIT